MKLKAIYLILKDKLLELIAIHRKVQLELFELKMIHYIRRDIQIVSNTLKGIIKVIETDNKN